MFIDKILGMETPRRVQALDLNVSGDRQQPNAMIQFSIVARVGHLSIDESVAKLHDSLTARTAGGYGNIAVANDISWASGARLTLLAHRNINVNAAITNTGAGHLTLRADSHGSGGGRSRSARAARSTLSEAAVMWTFSTTRQPKVLATNMTRLITTRVG